MCSNHIIPKKYIMFLNLNLFLPIFFGIILTCSLLVITVSNPIHSILLLVLVFCNSTALLLAFGIEFISVMLIIIYVGAIAILFLFVVMMLDIKILNKNIESYNYLFFCVSVLFAFFSITFLSTTDLLNNNIILNNSINYIEWVTLIDKITNTATIGQILYTFYLLYFLIAGIILLIALIGAVLLTLEKDERNPDIEGIPFKQISRSKENAIFSLST